MTELTLLWAEEPTHVWDAAGNPRKGTKQDTFMPTSCATGELSSRFRVAGKKINCVMGKQFIRKEKTLICSQRLLFGVGFLIFSGSIRH